MKIILILFLSIIEFVAAEPLKKISPIYLKSTNQSIKPLVSHGRLIGYLPGWKKPPPAQALAKAGYTHIIVAFVVFNTRTSGQLTPAFDTIDKKYIKQLQDLGIKVMLSIGGPSTSIAHTSVDYHKVLKSAPSLDVFQRRMIKSLEHLIKEYGFEGIDFDIEKGIKGKGTFTNPVEDIRVLADIINELHRNNPQLLISLAPQVENVSATPYFDHIWGNYASLIMQTHQALAWVGIQFYNSGCAYGLDKICYEPKHIDTPDFYVAITSNLLNDWPTATPSNEPTNFQSYLSYLKPSQIVLGFFIPTPNKKLEIVPISTIKRAVQCLNTGIVAGNSCAKYVPPKATPFIGGLFGWEVTYDEENKFNWAEQLKNCAINYECS